MLRIKVGARNSPLSLAQIKEVLDELRQIHPNVEFVTTSLATTGDLDQKTSLRTLPKNDFFTKEIDNLVLSKAVDIGIHSAKDLPDPLPKGLTMIALTKGVDPSDALVLREGETLDRLKPNALIATSSFRREETVKTLRSDLSFTDVRGNINQRLKLLEEHKVDGVVIAEAALIRLGLTHLNRIKLAGDTAPLQGQLAVVAREDHLDMKTLFVCIDCR